MPVRIRAAPQAPAMGHRRVCTTGAVRRKAEVQSKSQREELFSDMVMGALREKNSHSKRPPLRPPSAAPRLYMGRWAGAQTVQRDVQRRWTERCIYERESGLPSPKREPGGPRARAEAGPDLPPASANSDMIGWSRVLLSHTLAAARSY